MQGDVICFLTSDYALSVVYKCVLHLLQTLEVPSHELLHITQKYLPILRSIGLLPSKVELETIS